MSCDSFKIITGFRGKHREKGKFEWGTYDFFSCLFCSYRGSCGNGITTHYAESHNTEVCLNILHFRCNEDFKAWKTYVLSRGNYTNEWPNTKKDMGFSSVIGIAWCADGVDHFSETPLREIRGVCPSSIRATLQTDGSIIVDYISTHLGHRNRSGNGTKTADPSTVTNSFQQNLENVCRENSGLKFDLQNCFERTEELLKGSSTENKPEQSRVLFECGPLKIERDLVVEDLGDISCKNLEKSSLETVSPSCNGTEKLLSGSHLGSHQEEKPFERFPKIEPDIDSESKILEARTVRVKIEEESECFESTEESMEFMLEKQPKLEESDASIPSQCTQHTSDELAVSSSSGLHPDLPSCEALCMTKESKITKNRRSERIRKMRDFELHYYVSDIVQKLNKNNFGTDCKEVENIQIPTVRSKLTNTDVEMLHNKRYPRLCAARCGPLTAEEYNISKDEVIDGQGHRGTQTLVAPAKCYASRKDFKRLRSPDRSSEDEKDSKPCILMDFEEVYALSAPSVAPSSLVCPLDFSRFMPANTQKSTYIPKDNRLFGQLTRIRHPTTAKPVTIAERYVRFGRFRTLYKYVTHCKSSTNIDGNTRTSPNSLLTEKIRIRPIAQEVPADAEDPMKQAGPWRLDEDTTEPVRDSEKLHEGCVMQYPYENLTDIGLQKMLNKRMKTH